MTSGMGKPVEQQERFGAFAAQLAVDLDTAVDGGLEFGEACKHVGPECRG